MVKPSRMLGTLVRTTTKCIKLIFIGKITPVPVAFLMALSIYSFVLPQEASNEHPCHIQCSPFITLYFGLHTLTILL